MSVPDVHGVVPPVVTPLTPEGDLDRESLERLIEHLVAGGVNGLFMLGTTGEWSALPHRVRRDVVTATCRAAAGRVPVLVQVTDPCLEYAVDFGRHAADAGADAVILSSPYYYPLDQSELLACVTAILDRQPLPVILYNIPQMTGTSYEVETVRRLIDLPRVIAIKDSSGDIPYHHRLIEVARQRPDFRVLVGNEFLMAELVQAGSRGVVGGGANINPALLGALFRAAQVGDAPAVQRLNAQVLSMGRIINLFEPGSSIRGIKTALRLMGVLACDACAAPHKSCSVAETEFVAHVVRELDLRDLTGKPRVQVSPALARQRN
jgi:4-hydroxy-tetrahydrodipicolinate synthase